MHDGQLSEDLPEDTLEDMITKIASYASDIGFDWRDPREALREIARLCDKAHEELDDWASRALERGEYD